MPRSGPPSSTLLTEIMQRPLDPGYEAVARRRRHTDRPVDDAVVTGAASRRRRAGRPRGPWRFTTPVVVGGAVLGLVAGAAVAQLRSTPLQAQDRAVLEAEVERRSEVADALADSNQDLRREIEAEQAAAIGEGAASLLEATDRLGVVTGAVRVVGDGVVVELDDAPDDAVAQPGPVSDDSRVRDVDVQTVVNGLWAAGAEGIAVNDQRLTSLSTIRHAGDAIVVDLRLLARPYTITAVGDPALLLEEARTGSAGSYTAFLRDSYGIPVSVEAAEDLRLPAATRLTLRHAEGVPAPGSAVDPPEGAGQEGDGL